jgi:SAM-dependent methyltransferase
MAKHLDIGCGQKPRNPYNFDELYGLDISEEIDRSKKFTFVKADLNFDQIPFENNTFDSISAYDYLEHVPRVSLDHVNNKTYLPFISLINEIYRTLKPNGLFYASTPVYPSSSVFQDPTHVNFITLDTHKYFSTDVHYGRMYGFNGLFEIIQISQYNANPDSLYYNPKLINKPKIFRTIKSKVRSVSSFFRNSKPQNTHIIWELKAIK